MLVRRWLPLLTLALAGVAACERSATGPAQLRDGNAPAVRATVADIPVATRPHLLVDAEWLKANIDRPNVVVLYFGAKAKYDAGHIAGARFIAMTDFQHSTTLNGTTIGNELNDLPTLRAFMESKGVSTRDRVIATGDRIVEAARGFLMLEYLGYPQAAVLDGGLPAWVAAGGTVTVDVPDALPAGKLATPAREEEVVSTDWMLAHYADAGLTVIDALPASSYATQHIKYAKNLPYTSLMVADQKLVDVATMRSLFAAAGVDRQNQRVVVYCMSGLTSALDYFAARYLGFDASLYDSSWLGWSAVGGPKAP